MATVLDTHRIVKRLRDAGATEQLAETVTDVLRETRELDLSQVASKADLALVKADIAEARADLRREIAETKADLVRWVVGVGFAQVIALVGAVLALLRFFPGTGP